MRPLAILALAAAVAGCSHPSQLDASSKRSQIVNGTADTTVAHQAVVLIYFQNAFTCSGTYIGSRAILTAGHCLDDNHASNYLVGFGADKSSATRIPVALVMRHPQYDANKLINDVGLIRLAADAPADVAPIPPLPARLALGQADVNAAVDFIGFGDTEGGFGGSYGTKLHVVDNLDVICDTPAGCPFKGETVSPWTVCYDQQPGGPCSGDSGGPATLTREGQEYVVGITSYGDQGCAVFGCSTKVDHFADFIDAFLHPVADGGSCTQNAQCLSGHCVDGVCCNTACEPGCQACLKSKGATADGTCTPLSGACDDLNPCTSNDTCVDGACVGTQKVCPGGDQCQMSYCDRSSGQCALAPKVDGTACDDQSACTSYDVCLRGACTGLAKQCPAVTEECKQSAGCDPATAECLVANAPNGTECSKGSCHDGACTRCGCSQTGAATPAAAFLLLSLLRRRRRA